MGNKTLLASLAFVATMMVRGAGAQDDSTPLVPPPDLPPETELSLGPETEDCTVVVSQPGQRLILNVGIEVGTRLRFTYPIDTFQVSMETWDVRQEESTLWLRPKTSAKEADEAGVTVFLKGAEERRELDFLVRAAETTDYSCIYVLDAPTAVELFRGPRRQSREEQEALRDELYEALDEADAREEAARRSRSAFEQRQQGLAATFEAKLNEMSRQYRAQADDALAAFQYSIHTGYTWGTKTQAFPSIISAVYDDGRFTYIRLAESGFGVPAITAKSGEDFFVVQYDYQDLTGVYTVQGLFDELVVRFGQQEISIKRGS